MSIACPALLITAPSSGSGKTSVTAALARYHRRKGLRVRCFKTGPDFIDPTILVQASGQPVYNLDPWIMGVEHCRHLLFDAAHRSDLILIEGVMGLYDGEPSSADLARLFQLPILAVIDASAMAQTFGAVVHGLATYQADLRIAAVVANRIGSSYHAELLRASVPSSMSASISFSALPRNEAFALPERHLGLQIANEIGDLDARLDRLADAIADTALAQLPNEVLFEAPQLEIDVEPLLEGVTIAVACDAAFCFLYQAYLEWRQRMGAHLKVFSPLHDETLPEADAVYLPGGYPELYAAQLAANVSMIDALRDHVDADLPLLAECGGMLYLTSTLIDLDSDEHEMLDVIPATTTMQKKLAAIGSQQYELDGEAIRGHTFHYSTLQADIEPSATARTQSDGNGEAVYHIGSVIASYLHWYFPSNPRLIARWLNPK